jgi:aspartate oxidase
MNGSTVYRERASELLKKVKRIMWDHVGVVRTPIGLTHAANEIAEIKEEACDLFEKYACVETVGIRDASFAGQAVTQSALANRVSAGAHCIVLEGPDGDKVEEELCSSDDGSDIGEIGGFLRLR